MFKISLRKTPTYSDADMLTELHRACDLDSPPLLHLAAIRRTLKVLERDGDLIIRFRDGEELLAVLDQPLANPRWYPVCRVVFDGVERDVNSLEVQAWMI